MQRHHLRFVRASAKATAKLIYFSAKAIGLPAEGPERSLRRVHVVLDEINYVRKRTLIQHLSELQRQVAVLLLRPTKMRPMFSVSINGAKPWTFLLGANVATKTNRSIRSARIVGVLQTADVVANDVEAVK
jgi:hypothetical protein